MIEVKITKPMDGFTIGKKYRVESFCYCNRMCSMCLYITNDNGGGKYKEEARNFEVVSGRELFDKLSLKAYGSDTYVHCPQ